MGITEQNIYVEDGIVIYSNKDLHIPNEAVYYTSLLTTVHERETKD